MNFPSIAPAFEGFFDEITRRLRRSGEQQVGSNAQKKKGIVHFC